MHALADPNSPTGHYITLSVIGIFIFTLPILPLFIQTAVSAAEAVTTRGEWGYSNAGRKLVIAAAALILDIVLLILIFRNFNDPSSDFHDIQMLLRKVMLLAGAAGGVVLSGLFYRDIWD